jgi:hypothetical protein
MPRATPLELAIMLIVGATVALSADALLPAGPGDIGIAVFRGGLVIGSMIAAWQIAHLVIARRGGGGST